MSKVTTNNSNNSESTVTIDNIDEFLPIGADDVVTADTTGKKTEKPNFFTPKSSTSFDFLDKEEEEQEQESDDVSKALSDLDPDLQIGDDQEEENTKGRRKVDKSGLVETFGKLIEEGAIIPFDDEKPLDEYSINDWKDLITANFEEREKEIRENAPKEFFESLPEELQYAAAYVAKGGTDLKGLFKVLAQSEETRSLDPSNTNDQETIVREYLLATMSDQELVEEQLEEWTEAGLLGKKALQLKPKLDAMNEQVIQRKLEQQEQTRQKQIEMKQSYLENIMNTLKPGDLNGVKIDSKRQKFLWDELTTTKYQSMSGRPTNLLGKLLEDHQFGKEPRYDLIAEALWLLSDPDDYKSQISKTVKNEVTKETVRKLKTEESRKISSSVKDEVEETSSARKISRPKNIFSKR
jgi:hypothetical protein